MIITFIYRVQGKLERYYGKYIGYITDDYEEGLDVELTRIIVPSMLLFYGRESPSDIHIGILSSHRGGNDYFSEEEKNAFDLLYCAWPDKQVDIFFHGSDYH